MTADVAVALPPVWPQVYLGAARFIDYALGDLGIASRITDFDDRSSATKVLLGWSLLAEDYTPSTPYTLYQLEPMVVPHWQTMFETRRDLFERASVVFDYSTANVEWFEAQGIQAVWLPMAYHPKLRDVEPQEQLAEYDVLFTGFQTPRRKHLIERLSSKCCVFAHSRWGTELLDAISRSKIVLNLHQHDLPTPLEQPRVAYALNQGAFVLSEESADEPYPFLPTASYESLVDVAIDLLYHPARRKAQQQAVLDAFQATRSTARIGDAMARIANAR